MPLMKTCTATAVALGAMIAAAAPAQALVVTFAQFQAIGNKGQTYWKNNGTTATNGLGGSLYTTNTPTSTTPGSRLVKFSFLQDSIAPYVTNVTASYTLFASVTNTPAVLAGGQLIEAGLSGGFSFLTTTALTVGSHTYAAGANLLSGTFSTAAISGARGGTSGSFSGSGVQGLSLTYTSDFLSFDPAANNDFSVSLTAITSALSATSAAGVPIRALRTFRAFSTGSFSADPAPLVTAVPEPATWGLMIVGFGLVGVQARRRARKSVAA